MKQHITKEQWGEITLAQKLIFLNITEEWFNKKKDFKDDDPMKDWSDEEVLDASAHLTNSFDIGRMIEFLGNDWIEEFVEEACCGQDCDNYLLRLDEAIQSPCDTLWEAVKYKLNNQ